MKESVLEKAMFIRVCPSREHPGFYEGIATFGYKTFGYKTYPPVLARDKDRAVAFAVQALGEELLNKACSYRQPEPP